MRREPGRGMGDQRIGCGVCFFQAEDGIRYATVTGVQTCALPISHGVERHDEARGVADVEHDAARKILERKSVGEGKRVDLGGRRIIKKKKKQKPTQRTRRNLLQLARSTYALSTGHCRRRAAVQQCCEWNRCPGRWCFIFFSSRRRHTRCYRDWSSDVCSSDLMIRHTRCYRDWSSDVCSSDLQ